MQNLVILIGNLGKDPKKIDFSNGTFGVILSVATTDSRSTKKETSWHTVMVYDKLAELCLKYLTKGRLVQVQGRLQYRDRDVNGVKVQECSIRAAEVLFLDRPSHSAASPSEPSQEQAEAVRVPLVEATRIPLVEGCNLCSSSLSTGKDPSKFVEYAAEVDLKS